MQQSLKRLFKKKKILLDYAKTILKKLLLTDQFFVFTKNEICKDFAKNHSELTSISFEFNI